MDNVFSVRSPLRLYIEVLNSGSSIRMKNIDECLSLMICNRVGISLEVLIAISTNGNEVVRMDREKWIERFRKEVVDISIGSSIDKSGSLPITAWAYLK